MNVRYKSYLRACVGIGNLYGITLGYWICARGAEAAPIESTTMFMFVFIGNAVTITILQRALLSEDKERVANDAENTQGPTSNPHDCKRRYQAPTAMGG